MAQTTTNTNSRPPTLYKLCLCCYVKKLNYKVSTLDTVQQLRYLPPEVLNEIYALMSQNEELKDMLFDQLSDLEIFERLLRFEPARQNLFRCLAALVNSNKPLPKQLQENFTLRYPEKPTTAKEAVNNKTSQKTTNKHIKLRDKLTEDKALEMSSNKLSTLSLTTATAADSKTTKIPTSRTVDKDTTIAKTTTTSKSDLTNKADKDPTHDFIKAADALGMNDDDETNACNLDTLDFGMRLGSFLSEAGWLSESIEVLKCVASRLRSTNADTKLLLVRLDCLQRLLHSEAGLCSFKSAERTFDEILNLLKAIASENIPKSLLANTYTQFSATHFARSEYNDSHIWSVLAIRQLNSNTPERIAIDVLRQAAKACVVKRDFTRANMLICQAVTRARKNFGTKHPKYADAMSDYGFFLLNVDSVYQSVNVYKEALEIKRNMFGSRNFQVGLAHEDLSYAYYVHEYRPGNFTCAREHVEKAVDIMKDLVPSDHLMLASAKRVKALLLEEIALDKMSDGFDEDGLLKESEELHKFALQLSLEVFGEINVQTAKHYGNLGRLYQTMNRFEEAERMHQKAIKIKTDLLGPYDYEVGLSIGHLASLYNYQMKKYREAEELYLRSIDISLRLFGRSYSGLEYDYLGLCHVYETLHNYEKYLNYANILENWQLLRGQNLTMNKSIYPVISEDFPLEEVQNKFFNMCNLNLTACN